MYKSKFPVHEGIYNLPILMIMYISTKPFDALHAFGILLCIILRRGI